MYLAAVEQRLDLIDRKEAAAPRSARWQDFPHSTLSHHGADCCEIAREWVLAMDFAQLNGGDRLSGPRWLRQRYDWGPAGWPLFWCDAVERKVLDCGALAALAHEAFAARGVTSYPAQFVQQYSAEATGQWRDKWGTESVSDHWIDDDVIYHEGNALLVGGDEIKLWDASAGWWINPRQAGGYGALLSVRVWTPDAGPAFRWGEQRIERNQWQQV